MAQITKQDDEYLMTEFSAERNEEIYKNNNDEQDRGNLFFLIYQGLLQENVTEEFLSSMQMNEYTALRNWSMFGRMLYGDNS